MVQREVAERIAAPPGRMSYLSVFVQYHAARSHRVPRPADGVRAGTRGRLGGDRGRAVRHRTTGLDPAAEDQLWRLVQAASASAARCSTTSWRASCRSMPRARRARRWRRPGSTRTGGPRPSRSGSGWRCGEALGPIGDDAMTAVGRDVSGATRTALSAGRPARAGQVEPDPRGHAAAARRLPRPALGLRPARARRPTQPGGRRPPGADTLHVAGSRRRTRRADNLVLRALAATRRAAGAGWAGARAAAARSPPGSTSGSRSPPAWVVGQRMPPPPWTARWRPGAPTWTIRRAHAARRGARLGRPVLPRGRPGARRGPRRARDAAPGPARRPPGVAARDPAIGVSTPDVFAALRRDRPGSADGAARQTSVHLARAALRAVRAADLAGTGRACWRRPTTCSRPRSSCRRSSPFRRALAAPPAPADRALRVRPDALGDLSFAWPRRSRPRRRSARAVMTGRSPAPAGDAPFVAATTIARPHAHWTHGSHPRRSET